MKLPSKIAMFVLQSLRKCLSSSAIQLHCILYQDCATQYHLLLRITCMCVVSFREDYADHDTVTQFSDACLAANQMQPLCIAPLPDSYVTHNGTIKCLMFSNLLPSCLVALMFALKI
ncbi:TPA: hypothetical protein ACH3X3_002041 [Trebouxia sp. C0006]